MVIKLRYFWRDQGKNFCNRCKTYVPVDPSIQGANVLFAKDCSIMIDGQNIFDQPLKNAAGLKVTTIVT